MEKQPNVDGNNASETEKMHYRNTLWAQSGFEVALQGLDKDTNWSSVLTKINQVNNGGQIILKMREKLPTEYELNSQTGDSAPLSLVETLGMMNIFKRKVLEITEDPAFVPAPSEKYDIEIKEGLAKIDDTIGSLEKAISARKQDGGMSAAGVWNHTEEAAA